MKKVKIRLVKTWKEAIESIHLVVFGVFLFVRKVCLFYPC